MAMVSLICLCTASDEVDFIATKVTALFLKRPTVNNCRRREWRRQLFRNQAGERFEDVTIQAGSYFREEHAARGSAVGDLDDDGAIDIVASHLNEPVRVLRNRQSASAWLRIRLVGVRSARQPVGATLTLPDSARPLTRFVVSGAGYASHSDERIILPLSSNRDSVSVTVRWPGNVE